MKRVVRGGGGAPPGRAGHPAWAWFGSGRQGGEPLLAGMAGLRTIITELHSALRDVCELDLRIHTNGVRLDEAFCELFAEFGVRVGISIDGDRAANDRHRRYANGRSSYEQVVRAIDLLRTD